MTTFFGSALVGAKTGFRWTGIVVVPLALAMGGLAVRVFLAPYLNLAGDEFRRVRALIAIAKIIGNAIGFCVSSCVWGAAIGAVVGAVVHLVRRRSHVQSEVADEEK